LIKNWKLLLLKNKSIEKELVLPDAIEFWEGSWCGDTQIAKIFKFWRFRYFAIVSCVGILLLLKSFSIGMSLILWCFLLDYLILRSRLKKNFQVQLKELKKLLHEGFYESDKHREDPYESDIGKNKLLDGNPANILRKAWISKIAENYFRLNYRILDAGCKGGEISAPLSSSSPSIFGIDFNRSALKNFVKRFKGSGVQANVLDLPFKSSRFDAALCTEVIEHLFNPIQGLNEIANVIKPKGLLILSTDNRNGIKLAEMLNPFIIIERLIGLVFPKVLIPKNLIWKWEEKFKIYHSEYSRTELVSLVKVTEKFEIISYFSSSFLPGIYRIICRINPSMSQEDYLRVIFPIEKILAKIPIMKWLGDHWIMILRKT
jgi:ubiquinone/menaquinone biosynthesis C-methylase UbiE